MEIVLHLSGAGEASDLSRISSTLSGSERLPDHAVFVRGPKNADSPESGLTVREAYDTFLAGFQGDFRSAKTRQSYQTAIGAFEKWVVRAYRTTSPVRAQTIADLASDFDLLKTFSAWRLEGGLEGKPTSVRTAQRDAKLIRKVFVECRKRGLIVSVPDVPARADLAKRADRNVSRKRTPVLSDDAVCSVRRAIRSDVLSSQWPLLGDHSAATFWQDAFDFFATVGWSTQDAVAYLDKAKAGLQWSEVCWQKQCPDKSIDLQAPHGWLWLSRAKTGVDILMPMTAHVRSILQRWKGVDSDRVWPIFRNRRAFARCWNEFLAASDAPDDFRISEGRGNNSLRKWCAQRWQQLTGDRDVAEIVLSHSCSARNSGDNYLSALPKLVAHVDQYTLPWLNAAD